MCRRKKPIFDLNKISFLLATQGVGMTTQFSPELNLEAFRARLNHIQEALGRNQLVDTSLMAASKQSVLFIGRWLLQPLCALFGCDLLSHVRINNVASSLLSYCEANSNFLSADLKEYSIKILERLNTKSNKYTCEVYPLIEKLKTIGKSASSVDDPASNEPLSEEAKQAQRSATEQLTHSIYNAAYNVHAVLANKTHSFAFSPVGLGSIFGVLLAGAEEGQEYALRSQTGLVNPTETTALQTIHEELSKAQVRQVTCLAPERAPSFAEGVEQKFKENCGLELFVKGQQRQGRILRINAFVQEKTGITDLATVSKDFVGTALISALFVKAVVAMKIDTSNTVLKTCTFSDSSVDAKLVALPVTKAKIYEATEFTLVELAYENGLCKVMAIPNSGKTLKDIYPQLHGKDLQAHRALAQEESVKLYMPQMQSESKVTDMGNVLKDVGIQTGTLFDANVSSIATGIRFEEHASQQAVVAADNDVDPEQEIKELYVDRSFFYWVLQGNLPVIQGQVDSAEGLITAPAAPARGFFGLFS